MRIVILGAPGSGKGTQATILKDTLQVAHISTGELLRAQVAAGTPLGIEAQAVMARGELVSDAIVLGMLESRMGEPDVANGFLLDGYPRNLAQCQALDQLLSRIGMPVQHAIQLDVDEAVLLERLHDRARKEGRADDSPESVRQRLCVYQEQTAPVVDFYAGKGQLKRVPGTGSVAEISARILAALKG